MFGTTDTTTRKLLPPSSRPAPRTRRRPPHAGSTGTSSRTPGSSPFYRMSYLHVSDGTVKISPQSGMAVPPSIYNYAPAK